MKPEAAQAPSILFLDDNEVLTKISCEILEMQGYGTSGALTLESAWDRFHERRPDVVVADYFLMGGTGIDFAQAIWEIDQSVPFIIVTGGLEVRGTSPNIRFEVRKDCLFPDLLELLERLGFQPAKTPAVVQPLIPGISGVIPCTPEAVMACGDFARLSEKLVTAPNEIYALSPRKFEEFVRWIWEQLGHVVELTAPTRDGGRDMIAVRNVETHTRFLIECKRFSPPHKVGVGLVRSLYGVVNDDGSTKGILVTTSSFTADAREFINRNIWKLEGHDLESITRWLKLIRSPQPL